MAGRYKWETIHLKGSKPRPEDVVRRKERVAALLAEHDRAQPLKATEQVRATNRADE